MKLVSKLHTLPLPAKDLLLKKNTQFSMTTEEFLKCPEQPQNTCPMIDEAVDEISFEIQKLQQIDLQVPKVTLLPASCCTSHEAYEKNLNQIEKSAYDLESLIEDVEDLGNNLSSLRSDCENLRAFGSQVKELFWALSEMEEPEEEEVDALLANSPEKKFNLKSFEARWNALKISPDAFLVSSCEEGCENYQLNESLGNLFNLIESVNPTYPKSIDAAITNYELLSAWVESMEYELQHVKKLIITRQEKDEYVKMRNDFQKLEFQSWAGTQEKLSLIIDRSEVEAFMKESENMVRTKEINLIIDIYNLFSSQANEAMSEMFSHSEDVLENLLNEAKESRQYFFNVKEEKLKGLKGVALNNLSRFINNVQAKGLQEFRIEK